ncbi:hypothetical protein CHS0354_006595 [Potamilus streckersoni]|uniref:Uncharacterized protein n=1 Tax=Potamilus streckersoni TaxID=2493646 RepID=A0AAE0W2B0_9BIVA|nr:hypothetical protein CHS0354_006595 [Potamilus streckersoni]
MSHNKNNRKKEENEYIKFTKLYDMAGGIPKGRPQRRWVKDLDTTKKKSNTCTGMNVPSKSHYGYQWNRNGLNDAG